MTEDLESRMVDQGAGNLHILTSLYGALAVPAASQDRSQLDEQLYFEAFEHSVPLAASRVDSSRRCRQ